MKKNKTYKFLLPIIATSIVVSLLVGVFSLYFLFHYSIAMEERIYKDIDHHGEIDLHHICNSITCNGLYYNDKFYDVDKSTNEVSLDYALNVKIPSEILRYRNISLREDLSFIIPLRAEGFVGEAYFFVNVSNFIPNFMMLYIVLLLILNTSTGTIVYVVFTKEKILHDIELTKDKTALQFDNLMFYIENLNHEVNSPLFILARKVKDLESKVDEPKTFEIINNSIEQISAVMHRTREVKKINKSSEDRTLYDLIESTILTIGVMRAEKIKAITDVRLKQYYLDQEYITNGTFINIMTNHIKNSIEAFSDTLTTDLVKIHKNRAIFTFSDNGNGVPKHLRKKLFDKGFSTKGDKLVRGAGLSINKYIIESAGGSLKLNEFEGGAQFELAIPVKECDKL